MSKRIKIQIGLKKHKLIVIEDITGSSGKTRVRLLCECGNTIDAEYSRFLHVNKPKSCGCVGKTERANLVGQQFDRLVIDSFYDIANEKARWLAKCDCGGTTIATTGSLKNGKTRSCGCLVLETITKHGHAARNIKDLTYSSWQGMLQRCTNSKSNHFEDYGGRGITVCERWQNENGFIHFFEDMGPRPEGKTLDRIDNDLLIDSYSKKNCRWATPAEQIENRRNSSKSENYPEHIKWKRKLFSIVNNSINVFKIFGHSNSPLFKEYVGCSFEEFRKYIESLWIDDMSWENRGIGLGKWNIEHFFPTNNFDLSIEEDRYRCFHYSNLQPMWALNNLEKIKKDNKLYATI